MRISENERMIECDDERIRDSEIERMRESEHYLKRDHNLRRCRQGTKLKTELPRATAVPFSESGSFTFRNMIIRISSALSIMLIHTDSLLLALMSTSLLLV